jgi:hypothetical protein
MISGSKLVFPQDVSDFEKFKQIYKKYNYGITSQLNIDSINQYQQRVESFAQDNKIPRENLISIMHDGLIGIKLHMVEVKKIVSQSVRPSRNIFVPGMAISGASLDSITDPEVKKIYELALNKNEESRKLLVYIYALNKVFKKMIEKAEQYAGDKMPAKTNKEAWLKTVNDAKLELNKELKWSDER